MAIGTREEGVHPILRDRLLLDCVKEHNSAILEAIQDGIAS
jgi:hypothetical protein